MFAFGCFIDIIIPIATGSDQANSKLLRTISEMSNNSNLRFHFRNVVNAIDKKW